VTDQRPLPRLADSDNDPLVVLRYLHAGADRLLADFRAATGPEREVLRKRMRRFRAETLAGLLAGPHIPMSADKSPDATRAFVGEIDERVAQALREP
jgi:hypothetical protein